MPVTLALVALVASQAFNPSANPVTDALRDIATRSANNLTASAELMPADKYAYHPTDAQMTFGALMAHIVQRTSRSAPPFRANPRR